MKTALNLLLLIFTISFLNLSCKDDTITGPGSDNLNPGRRDYEWSVDTLSMPMNIINAIWGSSPSDVWVVGAGGDFNDRLLHYDGSKWSTYKKEMIICPGNTLFGFAKNNVWMGGRDGEIWHYDGIKWDRAYKYRVKGAGFVNVKTIWGQNSSNLYACGVIFYKETAFEPESHKGFVLHYDGHEWKEVCLGDFNSQFITVRMEQSKVYIYSYGIDQFSAANDIITFYELDGSKLNKIYSNNHGQVTGGCFELFGNELLFWINREVFKYRNYVKLKPFIKLFSITEPKFDYYIFGRNEKDVFICTIGGLAHYNGNDVQYLLHYPEKQMIMPGELLFEKDIFCGAYNFNTRTNMVIHGRLKE